MNNKEIEMIDLLIIIFHRHPKTIWILSTMSPVYPNKIKIGYNLYFAYKCFPRAFKEYK